ncbi:MAG: hypothetical protein ABIW84_02295 [Ilumatobacteraceae bacterium]
MLTKIKSAASTVGHGIVNASTAIHNANLQTQLDELDTQASALRKQLATIEDEKTDLKARKI